MRKSDLKDKEKVQAAVRQVADEYLKDPNINSVGVGFKEVDGKRTEQLSLQFTVGTKIAPEALEAAPTREIPKQITANGIDFETDVVERRFEKHPTAQEPPEKSERKRRLDPIVPGISIGHVDSTAGTLGCFVKDTATGELRLLSNWHVLQGETGDIGDRIMQPGPYDDNRIDQDVCGTLIRSFLGLGGDCAIADLQNRQAAEDILDLGVPVHQIGDPELDDRVVKSGRTTAVTFGRVTRVHTISKLSYGTNRVEQIGGFEIGPDDTHPADNGEISMGGDSGSAWMATNAQANPTDMMLGLHFAGETTEPAEYALACYTSSVFEKLEISPLEATQAAAGAPALAATITLGFNPDFLPDHKVDLPVPGSANVDDDVAPTKAGEPVRHYTHFTLQMSAARRFCRWVAWNVDGNGLQQLSRKDERFVLDPEYDRKYQVDDELYANNRLDRGHIARRADLLWGSRDEAQQANSDSFFFTNITPQVDDFNQSKLHGLWGELENAIFEDVDVDALKVSVIGGPIFKDTDFPYRDLLVPRSFWKIIAYIEQGTLRAKAYVLTQDDLEAKVESLGLEEFKLYQTSLQDLAALTQLDYGNLTAADTMPAAPEALGAPNVRRVDARSEINT
jgi:endonuclease G